MTENNLFPLVHQFTTEQHILQFKFHVLYMTYEPNDLP